MGTCRLAIRVGTSPSPNAQRQPWRSTPRPASRFARTTTQAAKALGCRDSSTGPARRCGDWSRTNKVARSSRCMAQSLRSGVPPEALVVQEGPPRRPVETTRVVIAVWRACADCFRSQLRRLGFGRFARRDPNEAVRTYHGVSDSTLKIGTFYFGGIRNFLLWSDTFKTPVAPYAELEHS